MTRRAARGLAALVLACGPERAEVAGNSSPGSDPPCATRQVLDADGRCRCPAADVLCPTGGYAHFTISNVEGSGLPNEAAYEVADRLVRDTVTGLLWERDASPEPRSWQGARVHCEELEIAGNSDFRLPGRIELVTLLDFNRVPVIASAFGDTRSDYHWTSSPASFVAGSAFSVYFGAGETTIASADPGRALARCVAGPVRAPAAPQFEVDGDSVRDRASGLTWERSSAAASTWPEARSGCEARGMRLPSIRELQSIVDENRYEPAIDPEHFPDVEPAGFWSITSRGEDPWYVDFLDGKTYADRSPNEQLASRCVH